MPERTALAPSPSHSCSQEQEGCFLDPCCQGGSWQGHPQGSEGLARLGWGSLSISVLHVTRAPPQAIT